MVRLGSALMAEALTELMQSRGYRGCTATGADPEVIIVDAATIGAGLSLRYPQARILFVHLEYESGREAALLSWHGAHAVIPHACTMNHLEKILNAPRVHRADGEGLPVPFTGQERKVIKCICRGDSSTKEIARELRISTHTVKVYVHSILSKTRAPNRVRLVTLLGACARREGHE
jgi:DNA-binding NarL/FixJ family response regulator